MQLHLGCRAAVRRHRIDERCGEACECVIERCIRFARERPLEALPPHEAAVGKPDAPGGEDAGERMDQDLADAERVRNAAGVLGRGASRRRRKP